MNKIETLLVEYSPGDPSMKPDVLEQIKTIDAERKRRQEEMSKANSGQITITKDGQNTPLNNEQIVNILRKQQERMNELMQSINQKDTTILEQNKKLQTLTEEQTTNSDNIKRLLNMIVLRDQELTELRAKYCDNSNNKSTNIKLDISENSEK